MAKKVTFKDAEQRRAYMDYKRALRRYKDAEERAELARAETFLSRVKMKLQEFKGNHPTVAKVLRIFLKIDEIVRKINAGVFSASLVYALLKTAKQGKAGLAEIKGNVPGLLIIAAAHALSLVIAWCEKQMAEGLA